MEKVRQRPKQKAVDSSIVVRFEKAWREGLRPRNGVTVDDDRIVGEGGGARVRRVERSRHDMAYTCCVQA